MAEFKFYLNRQGVRGPQGPQGEKGFSPDISVEKDTLSEYILRITNEGGYFLTTNLREHKEDRGGTYIRYDRAKGVMYAGDADPATTDTLGVIRIAKDDDFAGKAEDAAVTPAQIQNYVTGKIDVVSEKVNALDETTVKLTGKQTISGQKYFSDKILTNNIVDSSSRNIAISNQGVLGVGDPSLRLTLMTASESSLRKGSTNFGEILAQKSVTAGNNIAITETTNGIQISSTSGDVYAANDNTFTGTNTFENPVTVKNSFTVLGDSVSQHPDLIITKGAASAATLQFGPAGILTLQGNNKGTLKNFFYIGPTENSTAVDIRAAYAFIETQPYYLHQESIVAGDNISISKTEKGLKISSTGGGAGDVTLAGDNSFTGNNTFGGVSTFNGDTWVDFLKVGTSLKNQQDKLFLAQGSVTAGSDNLVIADTTDGIKITCNAPTNEQIGQILESIADLSTKINNLTNRVKALEETIDGGIA